MPKIRFSLRTWCVLCFCASIAIGLYVRWPYYIAAAHLDAAEGDKSFAEWPMVRNALIQDEGFRAFQLKDTPVLTVHHPLKDSPADFPGEEYIALTYDRSGYMWVVVLHCNANGPWIVHSVSWEAGGK